MKNKIILWILVMFVLAIGVQGAGELIDSYTTEDFDLWIGSNSGDLMEMERQWQSSATYNMDTISFKGSSAGAGAYSGSGKMNLSIFTTDCNGVFIDNKVWDIENSTTGWFNVTFDSPISLTSGVKYAVCFESVLSGTNYMQLRSKAQNTYHEAKRRYNDHGGTWVSIGANDRGINFKVYNSSDVSPPPTIFQPINLSVINLIDNYPLNRTSVNINLTSNMSQQSICSIVVNDTINQSFTYDAGDDRFINFTLSYGFPQETSNEYYVNCSTGNFTTNTTVQTVNVDTATSFEGVGIAVEDFAFSSSSYVNVTTVNFNTTTVESLAMFITLNAEKLTGGGNSDLYMRLIVNNVTEEEKLLRTMSTGSIGSTGSMLTLPNHPIGNHTTTLQVRRTNNGVISLTDTDFTITTSRSADKTDMNANVSEIIGSFSNVGLEGLYNLTTPSSNGWELFGVGISSFSATGSDIVVRGLSDGMVSQFTSSRDIGTVEGTMMFLGNITTGTYVTFTGSTVNGETISYHDDMGYIEMGDAFRPVNHVITKGNGNYTNSVNVFPSQTLFYETFTPESTSLLIMYQGAYNFTSAEPTWNLTIEGSTCSTKKTRTFAGDRGNVFFVKHCNGLTPFTPVNINLSIATGLGGFQSARLDDAFFIASSSTLDISVEPDTTPPNLTVTYPTINNNTENWINGTCTDNNVVTSLTVNNTEFTNTGDLNFWTLNYTGNTSQNISLFIQCQDFSGNQDNVTLDIFVDPNPPFCNPIANQALTYNGSFSWNVTCTDDQNFHLLNITCTGGNNYTFFKDNIGLVSYNFLNQTGNLTEDMNCNWIFCDAHTKKDVSDELHPFSVTTETTKLKIKGKKIFEVDDDLGFNVKRIDLDFNTFDRVQFQFEALDADTPPYEYVVHLEPEDMTISKIESEYVGHFVLDNHYWIDFVSKDIYDYEEFKIDDGHWIIKFKSDKKKLKFNSIGIINCNTATQHFDVEDAPMTLGIFDTAVCPDENLQQTFLYMFLIVLAILLILGSLLLMKTPWMGFFGSLLLMMLSFSMYGCFVIAGYVMTFVSILLIAFFGLIYKV